MGSGRFAIVPARAVEDRRIGHAALRVLCCLGTYSDKDGWCRPSMRTLSERLEMRRQTIIGHVQQLCRVGYVECRQRKRPDGGSAANEYRLLFDRGLFAVKSRLQETDQTKLPLSDQPTPPVGISDTPLSDQPTAPVHASRPPRSKNVPIERPYGRPPAAAASEESREGPNHTSKPPNRPAESLGKIVFGACLEFLKANGVKDEQARDLLGMWRKQYGEAAVIEVVRAAERAAASEPVAWIIAALKRRASRAAGAGRAAI